MVYSSCFPYKIKRAQITSFHAPIRVESPTVNKMGILSGNAKVRYLLIWLAPSISAASNKLSGTPEKNVLIKKILTGIPPATAGKITPQYVCFKFSVEYTKEYCDANVRIPGIIINPRNTVNSKSFPLNEKRVKPYAAILESKTTPKTSKTAIITVLSRYFCKYPQAASYAPDINEGLSGAAAVPGKEKGFFIISVVDFKLLIIKI